MTENYGIQEPPPSGSTGPVSPSQSTTPITSGEPSKDTVKEQARDVAEEGVKAGKHVASVAGDQAKEVASEAGHQAQALLKEARSELLDHASSQQQRVAEQLHALSAELGSMASKSEQDGLATGLAQQASRQVGTVAHWVAEREPGSMVGELKDYARSRPGTFLAVAAGIGLLAGRMTRGVKAGAPPQSHSPGGPISTPTQQGATASDMAIPPTFAAPAPGTPIEPPSAGVGVYSRDGELAESYPARPTGMTP